MKKSTILTFATAAAIVATSAGTFAAWDQTSAETAAKTLTVGQPVVLSTGDLSNFTEDSSRTLGVAPTYTSQVTFNVQDDQKLAKKLTLTPSLKDADDKPVDTTRAKVELSQSDDAAFTGTVDTNISATNTYDVKVTVLDDTLANTQLSVTVAGVLSE